MTLGNAPLTRLALSTTDHQLQVRSFRVEEKMSGLFRVELEAVSPRPEIDLSKLVGSNAEFAFIANGERRFRGLVSDMSFVRIADDALGLASYQLVIVPTLWRLTQRRGNRLFQHESIPEIVTRLLGEWQITHAWEIDAGAYPKLELRTQYDESDFDFMSRLLEEAGIAFWLKDSGDEDATLVLGDAPHANDARPGLPLAFVDEVVQAFSGRTEFVTNVRLREVSLPGRVTLRDHDPMKPRVPLFASGESNRSAERSHEQFWFAPDASLHELGATPGSTVTPVADDLGVARHAADRLRKEADLRLASIHAERRVLTLETSVNDLAPGTVFKVAGHPRDDISGDHRFLVLGSRFEGEVAKAEDWRFSAVAVDASHAYRPPRRTKKPRMFGLQTAVVVGENKPTEASAVLPGGVGVLSETALDEKRAIGRLVDEDIYVDEHGRVRVQFPWDREHSFGQDSSIWMRVSQGWAGVGYGMFAIPRVGHEVLVAFVDGDPDCPMVVGRVHNVREPAPFALPENKTVSTWKTASSPGGDGFNELRFDDAAGREHVYLQAQRDMDRLVKNDAKEAVGGNSTHFTQGVSSSAVGAVRTQFTNLDDVEVTGLNRTAYVGLNRASSVGVEDSVTVGSRWSVTVARGLTRRLVTEIETAAQALGATLRGVATAAMGGIQRDPLVPASSSALAGFGTAAFAQLRNVGDALRAFKLDPGPPPTSIEVVDRRITFTTGEASIVLDGPNVTISAQGVVAIHAHDNISLLSEGEVAVGARGKAALVSATDEVILQASKDLHLNPYSGGDLSRVETPSGKAGGKAVSYELCDDCGAPRLEGGEHECIDEDAPRDTGGTSVEAPDREGSSADVDDFVGGASEAAMDALKNAATQALSKDDASYLDALSKAARITKAPS